MFMHSNFIFVIAATALGLASPAMLFTQVSEPITDPAVYAIYATLLPARWAMISNGPMLLQMDTSEPPGCRILGVSRGDPEWIAAEDDFKRANVRVQTLQALLP